MTKQLNIGLIGAGRIGRVHAENLAFRIPEANLLMVADVIEDSARQIAERFRIPRVAPDYREILDNPDIHAVIICSSTDTHARFIADAAQAGKHIFCEKPIALELAKIDRALAAVERAQVKLQIGFNRRFDANYRRARQAVTSGEIGKPHLLHIISRDPAPPPLEYIKVSGGIFLDMTIHDFDMARFLIGSEVEEIYTAAAVMVDSRIGEAGDLDTALVILKFANGVIGTIDNSRRAVYGYDQRVEIFGDKGMLNTGNNFPNNAFLSGAQSIYRDLPLNFFMQRYAEAYYQEMVAFVDAIVNDKPVSVTGRDGRVPVVMGLAARKSYDERRSVKLREVDV